MLSVALGACTIPVASDLDEAADPDEHRFHIPAEHRWDAVRKHSTQIGQHLNNAFAAIEDANLRLRGVFGDIDFANQERFPDARLESLLAHFEKHRLRNADVPADMLGDLERAKIVITNYHAFKRRERMELSKGGRALLQGRGEELQMSSRARSVRKPRRTTKPPAYGSPAWRP